jgi:hypothetical protein
MKPVTCQATEYYNGHAYDLIFVQLAWPDAKQAATLLTPPPGFGTGHLTTISDLAEDIFVASAFGPFIVGADGAWAGMTDEAIEGEWRWIDSTPGVWQDPHFFGAPIQTAFVNWNTGEPNNAIGGNEDHLSIRGSGRFNDYDNLANNNNSYLVEFEPEHPPGDYNRNGTVDAADYVLWRKLVGHLVTACSGPDFNCNGFVEFDEYAPWRQNFGNTTANSASAVGGEYTGPARSIPEPSAMTLAGLLAFGSIGCSRRIPCAIIFRAAASRHL